jgi:hypothetical protein
MSEQRDIKAEGDAIKQSLTRTDEPVYAFSSAAESVYDGLNPFKSQAAAVTRFVPDFFYLGDICAKLFDSLRGDRSIQSNDDLCPFGFTAFIFYACIAHLFRALVSFDDVNLSVIEINTLFENSGFAEVPIPVIFHQWFQGVGEYISSILGRTLRPSIPVPDNNGVYFENFFVNGPCAHLFPNFRALFAKAYLLSTDLTIQIPGPLRNHAAFSNPNVAINTPFFVAGNSQIFRGYCSRIPGIAHLTRRHVSPQFASICLETLNMVFAPEGPTRRFLQLNPRMLRFLAVTYTPFVKLTNYFMTTKQATPGSDILECYLIERPPAGPLVGAQYNGEVPQVQIIPPIFDHIFSIRSKYKFTNGNMLHASVIPVIRLSVPQTRVPYALDGPEGPDDPQDNYFAQGLEYDTIPLTIQEAHHRFSRKK